MCSIVNHLNPVNGKYQIASPNLQTACRIHTGSYSVRTGGSAVEQGMQNYHRVLYEKLPTWVTRKTATLYYTQSVMLFVFTYIN